MTNVRRAAPFGCVAVAMSVLLALVAPPAQAGGVTTSGGSIQSSVCSTWTRWEGQNYDTEAAANYSPHGRVRHCVYRYKLSSSDRSAKYFLVYAESEYTLSGGHPSMPANAWVYIKSTRAAASGVYDAVDSYTSSSACSDGFTVSVGAGPVSASVTPKVCDNYKVRRLSRNDVGARWNAPRVGGVRRFATAYVLKIPRTARTTFTVTFWKPMFKHKNNGVRWIESGGYSKWETVL